MKRSSSLNRTAMTKPRRGFWTCQRRQAGVKCGHLNPNIKRKCLACGGAKPTKRPPRHMVALETSYEEYIVLNGGEHCGICQRRRYELPDPSRKLDRDHCHDLMRPRGLLCRKCNRNMKRWMTADWLEAAAAYLRRADAES